MKYIIKNWYGPEINELYKKNCWWLKLWVKLNLELQILDMW